MSVCGDGGWGEQVAQHAAALYTLTVHTHMRGAGCSTRCYLVPTHRAHTHEGSRLLNTLLPASPLRRARSMPTATPWFVDVPRFVCVMLRLCDVLRLCDLLRVVLRLCALVRLCAELCLCTLLRLCHVLRLCADGDALVRLYVYVRRGGVPCASYTAYTAGQSYPVYTTGECVRHPTRGRRIVQCASYTAYTAGEYARYHTRAHTTGVEGSAIIHRAYTMGVERAATLLEPPAHLPRTHARTHARTHTHTHTG